MRAEAEDERVALLKLILAWDRMRKCGAFAKRHKTAEGRLNADSDYVIEFLGHFVGNGVGAGFQNLIFGDASVLLDELAPGLNREVCEVHGAAHDA